MRVADVVRGNYFKGHDLKGRPKVKVNLESWTLGLSFTTSSPTQKKIRGGIRHFLIPDQTGSLSLFYTYFRFFYSICLHRIVIMVMYCHYSTIFWKYCIGITLSGST